MFDYRSRNCNSRSQKVGLPDKSRRDFVKHGAYVAPAILTLAAAPEFAKAGSAKPVDPKGGKGKLGKDKPGRGKD
jgi:hypothetical protein